MKKNVIKSLNQIINNQKLIYSIYIFIKNIYKNKRGRKYQVPLIYQIVITIFKFKYNLPERVLDSLLNIEHVIISGIIHRISLHIEYYGKGKNSNTYSGYKNYHGVKFQVKCDNNNKIKEISKSYYSSIHDKKVFLSEYKEVKKKLNQDL